MNVFDKYVRKIEIAEAYFSGDLSLEDAKREYKLVEKNGEFLEYIKNDN